MKIEPVNIYITLCIFFVAFTFSIYLKPNVHIEKTQFDNELASNGRLIWQKYNCQSCHQLFGLGGYLGPDLTNIISKYNNSDIYIKSLVKAGVKQMPSFTISDKDMESLIEFLKIANASGIADPKIFFINSVGMIEANDN